MRIPAEVSRVETERFLSDAKSNSHSCPSMLALILAVIALGAQHSILGKNGSCDAAKMEVEAQRGNVYSKSDKTYSCSAHIICSCRINAGFTIGFVYAQAVSGGRPNTHIDRKVLD